LRLDAVGIFGYGFLKPLGGLHKIVRLDGGKAAL
jgi:hypothetical protein